MSINYHFFGKDCLIDRALVNRSNLPEALEKQGFSSRNILFVSQVHGRDVVVIDSPNKIPGDQNLPKADAIVTNLKNTAIGVITADCSPILLYDEEKKVIAAAHAGWRGAASGVIAATVKEMKKLGAKNIQAAIGPMIQQESYEVSQEFFEEFLAEDAANQDFFMDGLEVRKYLFDLPSYVEKKLHTAGVTKIENRKIDTYKNEENFFSFRRSAHRKESDCGRNISVIEIG